MKASHNFVFSPNEYTGKWEAVHRDHYHELWNGGPNRISSSNVNTLVELIDKTSGNIDAINQLVSISEIKSNLDLVEAEYEM